MADEIKKVEIDDEDLDLVAGGRYSREEWAKMSPQERAAAQARSANARAKGEPCEMD